MTKLKIPIYPRPVSPLTAEPLGANTSDIYLDHSTESYSDNEQRATKRRRIEKLGEQYLRGDGLFIMTAGLKGPSTGWVNPWSKKHGEKAGSRAGGLPQERKEEVPETAMRVPGRTKDVVPVKTNNQDIARKPSLQGKINPRRSGGSVNWLKSAEDCNQYYSSRQEDSPTPSCVNNKVRNLDQLMSKTKLQHLASRTQATSVRSGVPAATRKQPAQNENLCPTLTLPANTKQGSRAEKSPSRRPQSLHSKVPAAPSTTNVLAIQSDTPFAQDRDAMMVNCAKEDGALSFDWDSARRSVHKLPPSTHLPEFEYRPVANPLKPLVKFQEDANNSSGSVDALKKPRLLDYLSSADTTNELRQVAINGQADSEKAVCTTKQLDGSALKMANEPGTLENPVEGISVPPGKIQAPSLSTQSLTTTITNAMPSAQVVPAVQFAESYPSTSGKMIEPQVTPTDTKPGSHDSPSAIFTVPVTNDQHELRATIPPNPTMLSANLTHPNHAESLKRPRSRKSIVSFSAFKSPPAHTAMTEPNTQQMLAAITPLGFSTAKNVPLKSINKVTSATATRAKAGKQKKQAAFAPLAAADVISSGSSEGSIKGSLKVSKMVSKQAKARESLDRLSQPSLLGKLGLDLKSSDEEGGSREESLLGLSPFLRGEPHLQGAPISSEHLHLVTNVTSTSSVQHQDAQQHLSKPQEEGQNLDDRQDFNLASAMDDLGSFLGTWDAEKEATAFGRTTGSNCAKSALKSKSSTASSRR